MTDSCLIAQSFRLIFQCDSFDGAITNVCEHALEKLNGILVHSDATVLREAADACKQLLESRMAVPLSSMSIAFACSVSFV